MSLMGSAMLIFFFAIGAATFVENDFGTPVAQKLIYKALWFETVLAYLFLSLCFNIYRYQLIQWKKIGSLVFHVSFLVIVLGAWITRMWGYEGAMLIREGESSNIVISSDTYLQMKVHDLEQQYVYDMPVIMDGHTNNYFEHSFDFPKQTAPVKIEFVSLLEHAKDTLVQTGKSDGQPYLEIVTTNDNGRNYNYLTPGTVINEGGFKIAFDNIELTDAISIFQTDTGICVKTPYELSYFQMSDRSEGIVYADSVQRLATKRLYRVLDFQFVFNTYYKSGRVETIESAMVEKDVKDVTVRASQGELSKEIVLRGGKGRYPQKSYFQLGDLNYELAYGSKLIELPFYIYLDDFELLRYPGTDNPSSYSSRVTLVDPALNLEKPHHIYMNNVLDYGGYRFFQSSYDPDELGTILQVNHDAVGTNVTYLGYLLLGLGFIISLFSPNGRFRLLLQKAVKLHEKREKMLSLLLLIGLLIGGTTGFSQNEQSAADHEMFADKPAETPIVEAEHAKLFSELIVQGINGRFQPVHTMATELLRKVSRSDAYNGLSAEQVFVGIHTNPLSWNFEPFVYVSGPELREKLGVDKYASFIDFFNADFTYRMVEYAEAARLKKPSERNQFDKDVLKTDERVSLLFWFFSGTYLKIMPLPNDPGQHWYSPFDNEHPFVGLDAEVVNSIMPMYTAAVNIGHETGDWKEADELVYFIDEFQRKVADPNVIPTKGDVKLEIIYNKFDIFKRLMNSYLLFGFLLIFLEFLNIFKPKAKVKGLLKITIILLSVLVLFHGLGLGVRWYLSGHAPWSNGYEAVVFIAFISMLLGLAFARNSKLVLGSAGLLGWLLLFVAHMNALDPEMGSLVPVLQSYWLMIHVAVITGSYAFLGISAILGLMILTMNLFLKESNKKIMFGTTKELTYYSEMIMIIGVFMLTIGTFLGGVWANESWGRYWGWDAKETWALASVIIYAIFLHFRLIPGLKGQNAFTIASLWGYSSIIMTFFGVNFYLSGLHSYATGDPIPVPLWVPITVSILLVLTVASTIKWLKFKKVSSSKEEVD